MIFSHDKYFNYEELTFILNQLQSNFPNFINLESLGKSKQGRDYWFVTLTNVETGPHDTKPAIWIDGNTHASEITGTQACVYIIDYLLDNKELPHIKNILDKYTLYAFPRISVDAAEHYIQTGYSVRSSLEEFPEHVPYDHYKIKDMDGDKIISQMRVQDSSGLFKISKIDNRLMLPREPWDDDNEGPFYNLVQEGELINYDGFNKKEFIKEKFDLNRQSPAGFKPTQYGAGPIPMFLNEGQLYARAILDRPNIFAINTYHTFGAVLLRPSSLYPDADISNEDLEVYKKMGEIGESTTGYKPHSIFHDFNYNPKSLTTGSWTDWAYDHRGIFSWTPEIWNIAKKAEVFFDKPLDYYRKFSEENLIKIINWCDKNLKKGSYFSEWRDFQHPQLGKVEVGGWKNPFVFTNPPPQFLKQELDGLSQFVIKLFQMGPKIEITKNEITNLGNDLSQVKMELKNSGYLPSYFSEKRKSVLTNIEPYVKLTLSKEQTIIQGKIETKIPHLLGRSRSTMWHNPIWGNGIHNPNELQMKWTIKGKGEIQIVFDFLGAGILKSRITI